MALIECSECGAKISDSAATCPKCGCPGRDEKYFQMLREHSRESNMRLKMALGWTLVIAAGLGGIYEILKGGTFGKGLLFGGALGITIGWAIASIVVGIISNKELERKKKDL